MLAALDMLSVQVAWSILCCSSPGGCLGEGFEGGSGSTQGPRLVWFLFFPLKEVHHVHFREFREVRRQSQSSELSCGAPLQLAPVYALERLYLDTLKKAQNCEPDSCLRSHPSPATY